MVCPVMKAVRQMTVRVSPEELQEWKIAAALRGYSLSEWTRRVLNVTAKGVRDKYGQEPAAGVFDEHERIRAV
jgi:hypothetical protein